MNLEEFADGISLMKEDKEEVMEGRKDDQGKNRLELIPPELLTAIGSILTFGAEKYDDRNWEKGMDWGRVYGALQRHLWAWWNGEEFDPETGKSHLWHAGCCIAFLIAYEERNIGTDSRPNRRTGSDGNDRISENSGRSSEAISRELDARIPESIKRSQEDIRICDASV